MGSGVTRTRYASYLLARIIEAAAIAAGAALIAHLLQQAGMLHPARLSLPGLQAPKSAWAARALDSALWCLWPVAWAGAAHLILGPKQRVPVYLKIPGAMYALPDQRPR